MKINQKIILHAIVTHDAKNSFLTGIVTAIKAEYLTILEQFFAKNIFPCVKTLFVSVVLVFSLFNLKIIERKVFTIIRSIQHNMLNFEKVHSFLQIFESPSKVNLVST